LLRSITKNDGKFDLFTFQLAPPRERKIGSWTEAQFIQAVKYGKVEGLADLRYPMPNYALLSDSEIAAIYSYLQTIPAIENKIERNIH
jgi:hypothetical protein